MNIIGIKEILSYKDYMSRNPPVFSYACNYFSHILHLDIKMTCRNCIFHNEDECICTSFIGSEKNMMRFLVKRFPSILLKDNEPESYLNKEESL